MSEHKRFRQCRKCMFFDYMTWPKGDRRRKWCRAIHDGTFLFGKHWPWKRCRHFEKAGRAHRAAIAELEATS